jgi:hypothetical protein
MRRRSAPDSLATVNEPRWLVVRDRFSVVKEWRALRPKADLRALMNAEWTRRIKDGWHAEAIPRNCSFFFCNRENERICVTIECFEPGARGPRNWQPT